MRISDWSSDVCSSDLLAVVEAAGILLRDGDALPVPLVGRLDRAAARLRAEHADQPNHVVFGAALEDPALVGAVGEPPEPRQNALPFAQGGMAALARRHEDTPRRGVAVPPHPPGAPLAPRTHSRPPHHP